MSRYNREDGRRKRKNRHRKLSHFKERKRHGWGMGLYRNRREGKIFGVCAGIADYWDVANWVVRLIFIGLFLFTGSLALWAYGAGVVLLSKRPDEARNDGYRRASEDVPLRKQPGDKPANEEAFGPEMEYDERYHDYRPKRMFRYSESANVRLARARERLDSAVSRVEDIESYVTSRRFKLNRELSRL
ncbi:MAG: PspC domain-containing protein [Congregibacter sp.]